MIAPGSSTDAATGRFTAGHVVVGGGLAGGLVALALAEQGRGPEVVLVERDTTLGGGEHTWCYHQSDLEAEGHALLLPIVTRRWPAHLVRFPGFERAVRADYGCVAGGTFRGVVAARLASAGVSVRLASAATHVGPSEVRLDDGTVYCANVVIDARGPEARGPSDDVGFQKFVGLELELLRDGPWAQPVLMDATVPQLDGYRFVYVLPFSPRRVLVEDTMYSSGPGLNLDAIEQRILGYAEAHGAAVGRVTRREIGVLALPLRPSASRPTGSSRGSVGDTAPPSAIAVGYRGGFFHPVTGYSLPIAVRVALAVAKARTRAETAAAVNAIARALEPQRRFGALLNRLLFEAMPPAARWTAFERFYRLPDETIARFYASRSTWRDRARMLVGRPPRGISWLRLVGARRGEA